MFVDVFLGSAIITDVIKLLKTNLKTNSGYEWTSVVHCAVIELVSLL